MDKEDRLPINDNDSKAVWDDSYTGSRRDSLNESVFLNSNSHPYTLDTLPVKVNGSYSDYYHEGLSPPFSVEEYSLKRPLDVVLSLLGILFCLPISIMIAVVIWLEDRGEVLFCSERVGKDGRLFKHIKFRTMMTDSDKHFGPLQAEENDRRVTRVGRLLRATAIDELPQLLLILKGDMSIVGPRPLLRAEIEARENPLEKPIPIEKIPGYRKRHSVRPGLTGLAQIFAPRDIIRRRKFQYDLLYVKRQNLLLDIKLISLSFWITVRGKWECRGKKI